MAGCKAKTDDSTSNYTSAINTYYASRPECLWAQPVKLPVQADTSDTSKTMGYDALVDQGLLQRTTGEKKRFLIGSKEVTNYDLSDKGRSAWTADQQTPGFGNFCYGIAGRRKHQQLDREQWTARRDDRRELSGQNERRAGMGDRRRRPRMRFRRCRTDLSGPVAASATLTDTDHGWVVTKGPAHAGVTNADQSVVQ